MSTAQVRVTSFKAIESGSMLGLLNVEVDIDLAGTPVTLKLNDCKLMASKTGGLEWIALPSSSRIVSGSTQYFNNIGWGSREEGDHFGDLVINALEEFRGGRGKAA